MSQLTLEGRVSETDIILGVIEELGGRVDELEEVAELSNRRGAFAGHSVDKIILEWQVKRVRGAIKTRDKVTNLPHCIHAADTGWVQLRLSTREEAFAAFVEMRDGAGNDIKSLLIFRDYLVERFHDSPSLQPIMDLLEAVK